MKNKTLIIISVLSGIAIVGFLYFKSKKPKVINGSARGVSEDVESKFPLAIGSEGDEVKILQKYLNNSASCKAKAVQVGAANVRMKPLFPLDEDGIFGELTESVLLQCYNSPTVKEETFNNMKLALEKNNVL